MELKKLENGSELLEELKSLQRCERILSNKEYGKNSHFQLNQHYGRLSEQDFVSIGSRHTERFMDLVRGIIAELEEEIRSI